MDKRSNEGAVCTYCDKEALSGTYPPVCSAHINEEQDKHASSDTNMPNTLKELNAR